MSAILEHGDRSAELEGPDSPWRPVITWALGWAHYCNDDLDAAERWLKETTEIAPPSEQWIVGVAAIADLSLIAGLRGRRAEQMRLALEAVDLTREVGLLDAVEDGEVHTALRRRAGRARPPAGGAAGAREGRLPTPPVGAEARPDRRPDRARDDGRGRSAIASARRRCSRRRRRSWRPAATRARSRRGSRRRSAPRGSAARRPGDELSERELTVLRHLSGGLSEREIAAELYLSFNTVHSHVKSIYRKLGVSSRAEALARASDVHLGERPR